MVSCIQQKCLRKLTPRVHITVYLEVRDRGIETSEDIQMRLQTTLKTNLDIAILMIKVHLKS